MKETVAVLWALFLSLILGFNLFMIGSGCKQKEIQHQLIKEGYATWVANESGNPEFTMIPQKSKE